MNISPEKEAAKEKPGKNAGDLKTRKTDAAKKAGSEPVPIASKKQKTKKKEPKKKAGDATAKVKDAVTTLRALAGLKTVIKPVKDAQSANHFENLNAPCLIATHESSIPSDIRWASFEIMLHWQSIEPAPMVPPPQIFPIG